MPPAARPDSNSRAPLPVLIGVTLAVGVASGLLGMLLALLLHLVQHLAYGYSLDQLVGPESFLEGVSAAAPLRRLLVLLLCGALAGLGWWALHRWGRPLPGVAKAIASEDPRLPAGSTGANVLLQMVTVALGSPLGREVAPREAAATFAGWLAQRAGLSLEQRRVMVGCAAGAGLAAVYNVPLGGALFALEVLLGSFAPAVVIQALITSTIAAAVAWIGLGNALQYEVPHFSFSWSLAAWALLCGPLFGVLGYGFSLLTQAARRRAPRDARLLPYCLVVFGLIGLAAMAYPQLLGNGRGPAQLGFDADVGLKLAAVLLLLKVLATAASLRAGAEGGLLTPSVAIGAMLATLLGGAWNLCCPAVPAGAFALVGAAAFLAAVQRMPLTASVLLIEMTGLDHDFWVPLLLAVAGSSATLRCCLARQQAADTAHHHG
jgi:H+/Cl- antiporter ClcA